MFRWTTKQFQLGRKTKIWSVTRTELNIYSLIFKWAQILHQGDFLFKHRDSNLIKLECYSNNIVAFSNCTFPTNSTFIKSTHLQPATQHSQSNSLNSPVVHILAVLLLNFWRPLMELRTQNVKSKDNTIIQTSRRGLFVFVHQMLLSKQCRDNRERSEVSFQTNNETFLKVE